MATTQVKASAPVVADGFRRYTRVGLVDGDYFDIASEPTHTVSNGGFDSFANNQNCRWCAAAKQFDLLRADAVNKGLPIGAFRP
jgi:hypothetical protein